ADRNRSHWSTSKTPSYTKSVSWQHHPFGYPQDLRHEQKISLYREPLLADDVSKQNPDIMDNGWA
ncbi:hypothetical protein, partial [Escherichia coli]|uniref:hypothetical protein n=1 Tax=Escherichia coli TaxID=562 RepID=UPI001CDB0A51